MVYAIHIPLDVRIVGCYFPLLADARLAHYNLCFISQLGKFYEEHIHTDDETRFVLEGSGYFDIRDPRNDKWIRIEVIKDDMISIPAGLYHRFTLDTKVTNCFQPFLHLSQVLAVKLFGFSLW